MFFLFRPFLGMFFLFLNVVFFALDIIIPEGNEDIDQKFLGGE